MAAHATKGASATKTATIDSPARRRRPLPEETYVEGELEPVAPEERAVVPSGRAWVPDETGELAEELLEGLSLQSLQDLMEATSGGPTGTDALPATAPATATATATGTGTGTGESTEGAVGLEPEVEEEEAFAEEEEEEEEAPLDRILAQRTATWRPDEEEEEETGPGLLRPLDLEAEQVVITPRQPDEFVCSGCFLLKRRELLADPEHGLCRDCAG